MGNTQKNDEFSFSTVDRVVPIVGAPAWYAARSNTPPQGLSR